MDTEWAAETARAMSWRADLFTPAPVAATAARLLCNKQTGRMETGDKTYGDKETGRTSGDGEEERAEQSPRVLVHELLSASVIVERHARPHEPSARRAPFTYLECWLLGRT